MASDVDKPASDPPADTSYWLEMIERYDRGTQEWRERCEKIVKIYLDQHRTQASPRRFALLWSNIETLKPAIYARLPVAVVSRRYKDQDPAGRKASEILERCINTTFDLYGLDEVMQLVRDDRLLCSRGAAWVRYEADVQDNTVNYEKVCCEYVHWADFGHSLHRTWPEVTTVWRRVYMTREKVTARWDKKTADKLNYEVRPEYAMRGNNDVKDATEPQAIIYEIWDKPSNQAIWLAKEEKISLEQGDVPLKFREFFPCPKPVYGSKATGSLIPTPDYRYYQDQAEEIDDLTQKIADLTGWLRLKGFYAGGPSSEGADAIEELLKLEGNQVLVKVESWAGFAEKGGVKGLIEWIPLDVIVVALREAVTTRTQLVNDVYQISGISDILRGETDPQETLGAQEIKAQTGTRRQAPAQREIARFARDLAEMVGEIVAEQFAPETISEMSGMDMTMQPPPELLMQIKQAMMQSQIALPAPAGAGGAIGGAVQPQGAAPMQPPPGPPPELMKQMEDIKLNAKVMELLRDEKTLSFRIEIETDSTIEPDEQAEKQRRIEFLQSVGDFIQRVTPTVQLMPEMGPLVGEMMMFMVRGFRAGRSMEDIIEKTMAQLNQKLANPQPPPPDPHMMAAQAKMETDKANFQLEQQRAQQQAQLEQQQAGLEAQAAAQKHEMEMQKAQTDMQAAQDKHGMEMEKLRLSLEADMAKLRADLEMKQVDADQRRESHEMDMHSRETEQGMKLEEHGIKSETAAAAKGGKPTTGPLTAALKDMTEGNRELAKQLLEALTAQNKPKRIRGPSGKVYQIEPIH